MNEQHTITQHVHTMLNFCNVFVGRPHGGQPYLADPAGRGFVAGRRLLAAPVKRAGRRSPESTAAPSVSSSDGLGLAVTLRTTQLWARAMTRPE